MNKISIQHMANAIGVSFSALITRLRVLGFLEYRDLSEYIETEMNFGGDA